MNFLIQFAVLAFVSSHSIAERIPCDKNTDIRQFGGGSILCHYSMNKGGFINDQSGNGNNLVDGVNTVGMNTFGSGDYRTDKNGYIIFPEECNLPRYGFTLFTVSGAYGPFDVNSRTFGDCDSHKFVSGLFQPFEYETKNLVSNTIYSSNYKTIYSNRPTPGGVYASELTHTTYPYGGWIIQSDTLNSVHINGAEITKQIPMYTDMGYDIPMCFNYVNGEVGNAYYWLREYIVFGTELNNEERRCVEEHIFDTYNWYQSFFGLAPYNP
eukprot:141780_1